MTLRRRRPVWPWAPLLAGLLLGAACSSQPPIPDWQLESHGALQRSVQAFLEGNDRVATQELQRARREISATGRPELLARAELLACAAQAASLQLEACSAFDALRADAGPAERAYADHLQGRATAADRSLLPAAQQTLLAADSAAAALAAVQSQADPLSRLLAAALVLKADRATPELLALAVDTASAQGWRRPLLAWLRVQQRRAELAGQADEAARLGRRITLVLQGGAAP